MEFSPAVLQLSIQMLFIFALVLVPHFVRAVLVLSITESGKFLAVIYFTDGYLFTQRNISATFFFRKPGSYIF
jgi:hypothetical protein